MSKKNPANTSGAPPVGPKPPRRDQVAIQLVLAQAPKLIINSTEDIFIELPLSRGVTNVESKNSNLSVRPEDNRRYLPLQHERVRAEMAELIYSQGNLIAHEQELSRILTILEGIAWKKPLQEIEADQILDENPLLEAIYICLKQSERGLKFSGTCSSLLSELTRIGKRKGIDLNSKHWPGGPAQLSKKLGEQVKHLKKVGIEFTRGRRPGGERYVTISLQPENLKSKESKDAGNTASQEVSDGQPQNNNEKLNCDAGDDDLKADYASINQLSKENKDD